MTVWHSSCNIIFAVRYSSHSSDCGWMSTQLISYLQDTGFDLYNMREWLSGGAPPCQGGGRGFDSRLALTNNKRVMHLASLFYYFRAQTGLESSMSTLRFGPRSPRSTGPRAPSRAYISYNCGNFSTVIFLLCFAYAHVLWTRLCPVGLCK